MTFFSPPVSVSFPRFSQFTMKGFDVNQRERLMGRKTPRLSMLESGTDADMTLLSCCSVKERRRKDTMGGRRRRVVRRRRGMPARMSS